MAFSTDAVANFILDLAAEAGVKLSSMKLLKLVYFSHGWHLALTGKPLINEPIRAWKFGPVIPSLYHEFKSFGNGSIDRRIRQLRMTKKGTALTFEPYFPALDEEGTSEERDVAKAVIRRVWRVYGAISAVQLSNMTHEEGTPWTTVLANFRGGEIPKGVSIPNELIQTYFKSQLPSQAVTAS